MDMQIVIPTYRRMPRQATLGNLPEAWAKRTTLVVDESDASLRKLYDLRGATLLVHPPDIKTIAQKRAWILSQPQFDKIVMFDDDLRFAVRHADTGYKKLHQATSSEIDTHLRYLDSILDAYIHAGWSPRQGNNNQPADEIRCGRQMFVLGYRCDRIRSLVAGGEVVLGRVATREDMELTVQLLKLGYENVIDYRIAADQVSGYAAKGGCSEERTIESTSADAEAFAALHPGYVKVVEKKYEGSPNRKEVVVQWKKCYQASLADKDAKDAGI
jgi:hypothetical protein